MLKLEALSMPAKPNQPQNVVRHLHLWATPAHEAAEAGRIDVCELADGEVVIWDVDPDHLTRAGDLKPGTRWTWDEAMVEAKACADCRAELSRAQWVRVMCDFSADPVWAQDGTMAEIEDLPVPLALRERLRAWWISYEDHDGFMPEPGRPPVDPAVLAQFSAEGLALARAVKASLPEWTVIYYDEAKGRRARVGGPRSAYEYEVTI